MAKFIEGPKFKQLKEAMKNGDGKAKAILMAQYNDTDDFDDLFNDYFSPKQADVDIETVGMDDSPIETTISVESEEEPGEFDHLDKFLKDNGVDRNHPDAQEYIDEFYNEFPGAKEHHHEHHHEEEHHGGMELDAEGHSELYSDIEFLVQDEVEAVTGYNEKITAIKISDQLDEEQKTYFLSKINKIRDDELEHITILKELQERIGKCDEKQAKKMGGMMYGE